MKIERALSNGWASVASAHSRGLIWHYEMLAFSFCKALTGTLGNLSVVYDGRRRPQFELMPQLFITAKNRDEAVQFVGKFRFEPPSPREIIRDVIVLTHQVRRSSIPVLRDGETKTLVETPMAADVAFGYFLLSDRFAEPVELNRAVHLSEFERSRFHLGVGSTGTGPASRAKFEYYPPTPRH